MLFEIHGRFHAEDIDDAFTVLAAHFKRLVDEFSGDENDGYQVIPLDHVTDMLIQPVAHAEAQGNGGQ